MKHRFYIDSHKGITGPVVLGLIAWYHAWDSTAAFVYLALHGTYGLLWITKSRVFGDKSWEREVPLWYGLYTWAGLSMYWVSPWLIASGRARAAPPWFLAVCISLYTVGIFLHFTSDMQKHMSLTYRKGTLLTEGLWARTRNPNYLGELAVYLGFSLLPLHPAPLVVMALVIAGIWVPNMLRKDRSLARYPDFAAYRARSKLLLPFIL